MTRQVLESLQANNSIQGFHYKEQVPSCVGDYESRLIDEIDMTLNDGTTIKITTWCSGSLENTCLNLEVID